MAESGAWIIFCKKWSLEDEGVHELLENAAHVVDKRWSLVGAGFGSMRCLRVVGPSVRWAGMDMRVIGLIFFGGAIGCIG